MKLYPQAELSSFDFGLHFDNEAESAGMLEAVTSYLLRSEMRGETPARSMQQLAHELTERPRADIWLSLDTGTPELIRSCVAVYAGFYREMREEVNGPANGAYSEFRKIGDAVLSMDHQFAVFDNDLQVLMDDYIAKESQAIDNEIFPN
jgi:hypothetical protein